MEVHPKADDFSPGHAGRILISAKHGGGYYTVKKTTAADTPAQTQDQQVVISAYVSPKKAGQKVFFEVIDPDDPVDNANEFYKEDKTPLTPLLTSADIQPAVDINPNDNRDPNRSMFGGTLAKYNAFQGMLSQRSATTVIKTINGVERAVAEVTLTFTGRYSGDNYIVRATCVDPENKPFNDKSGVTADTSADAEIAESKIAATTVLTAWKRIYIETGKMFRVGADLSADSGKNQADAKIVHVDTSTLGLAAGDTVQVFDTDNQLSPFGEVGEVDQVQADKIIFKANLTQEYSVSKKAHVGKLTDASDPNFKAFYEVQTGGITTLFDQAFVNVRFEEKGSGILPFKKDLNPVDLLMLSQAWFFNKDKVNYFHLMGAQRTWPFNRLYGQTQRGVNRLSCVLIAEIEDDYGGADLPKAVLNVTAHELTHQLDEDPKPPTSNAYHHPPPPLEVAVAPLANVLCLMNVPRVYTHAPSWCIYHVYAVRDQNDPK